MGTPVKWFPGVDVTKLYPSMAKKAVLITGGGGGLGMEASTQLAKLGARVYLSDVREELAVAAAEEIVARVKGADVIATPALDLNSFDCITTFVKWFDEKEEQLDVLINNAGNAYTDSEPFDTVDGFKARSQVLFLGHYVLTRKLEHLLVQGSRVISIASVFHRVGEALPGEVLLKNWKKGSYRNCKLALVMFTQLLQERWKDKGVICAAVDPGGVMTGIWSSSSFLSSPICKWLLQRLLSPPEDGVATYIHTAASGDIYPGGYYARGLFASDFLIKLCEKDSFGAYIFSIMAFFDWGLRWISRGALLSSEFHSKLLNSTSNTPYAVATSALFNPFFPITSY